MNDRSVNWLAPISCVGDRRSVCLRAVLRTAAIGLLGCSWSVAGELATNPPAATGAVAIASAPSTPAADRELTRLMAEDDAAQAEIDGWIKEDLAFKAQGAGQVPAALNARIDQRIDPVIKSYEDFVRRYPEHVRGRLAYGTLLNDLGREEDAYLHFERARQLDPKSAAAWNNLGNYYSHKRLIRKALEAFSKAAELNPDTALYQQNLATCVFMFRAEAKQYFQWSDDQQVLRRALEHFKRARKLDPQNFALATDLAQVYYHLRPEPGSSSAETEARQEKLTDEALGAWREALRLAHDDLEREGVLIHMARVCVEASRFAQATEYLGAVKDPRYDSLRQELERKTKPAAAPPANK